MLFHFLTEIYSLTYKNNRNLETSEKKGKEMQEWINEETDSLPPKDKDCRDAKMPVKINL